MPRRRQSAGFFRKKRAQTACTNARREAGSKVEVKRLLIASDTNSSNFGQEVVVSQPKKELK